MKNIAILIAAMAIVAVAFVPVSYAACSNACSSTQYTCSLTTTAMSKGTSGTLTVSITNQQSQSQSSVTATLIGNWFTGDTVSQVISSITSGESKSLDFTLTPNTAGSQDVCVDMASTCTADCTAVTINSAADLSIVSLSAPSSVSPSQSFTVSGTMQNGGTETAGGDTAITAILEDTSGKCTIASATKSIGTIGDSATSSQSWSVTAGTSGTCTFILTVSGSPGGTDTEAGSTAISSSSGTSNTGSGSGSGGSSGGGGLSSAAAPEGTTVSTSEGVSLIKLPSVSAGQSAGINIDKPEETGVRRIAFTVSKDLANISIEIRALQSTDKETPTGKTQRYIEIILSNISDADITAAQITFEVQKKWLSDNGFAASDVALMRYASGWTKLSTSESGSTDEYVYYTAETLGFSLFAISAVKQAAADGSNGIMEDTDKIVEGVRNVLNDYGWYIALAVFVIALILGWIYYHGHEHIKEIKQQLGQGKTSDYVINISNKKPSYSFSPSKKKTTKKGGK